MGRLVLLPLTMSLYSVVLINVALCTRSWKSQQFLRVLDLSIVPHIGESPQECLKNEMLSANDNLNILQIWIEFRKLNLRPCTTHRMFVKAMLNGVSKNMLDFGTGYFSNRKYGVVSSSTGVGVKFAFDFFTDLSAVIILIGAKAYTSLRRWSKHGKRLRISFKESNEIVAVKHCGTDSSSVLHSVNTFPHGSITCEKCMFRICFSRCGWRRNEAKEFVNIAYQRMSIAAPLFIMVTNLCRCNYIALIFNGSSTQ